MRLYFVALCLVLLLRCETVIRVVCDVGTASSYGPPYLPTRCSGYSKEQIPENGYFAAVGDGLWDNGAACGRRYLVSCISGPRRPCKSNNVMVTVVDYCRKSPCRSTMQLSNKAFNAISRSPKINVNVEYTEV